MTGDSQEAIRKLSNDVAKYDRDWLVRKPFFFNKEMNKEDITEWDCRGRNTIKCAFSTVRSYFRNSQDHQDGQNVLLLH